MFIIRNTVEELVFNLFGASSSSTKETTTGLARASKALEVFNEESKMLTIGDVMSLFKSL